MNITPVSYKAYNSKNQTNQQSPNFKATIVATIADVFEPHIGQWGNIMVDLCSKKTQPGTIGCITSKGNQIHIWMEDTVDETQRVANEMGLELARLCFPKTAVSVHTKPEMTQAIKDSLGTEAPFTYLSQA